MTDVGSSSGTVDHMIFVIYFEPVPRLDLKVPKIRLFYLHIDHNSWRQVGGKHESPKAMIDFNMYYTDATFTMTWMPSEERFAKFQAMTEKLCNKPLKELEGYVNVKVVLSPQ
jgi:hypothetical protein